jgi:hypothetical protein
MYCLCFCTATVVACLFQSLQPSVLTALHIKSRPLPSTSSVIYCTPKSHHLTIRISSELPKAPRSEVQNVCVRDGWYSDTYGHSKCKRSIAVQRHGTFSTLSVRTLSPRVASSRKRRKGKNEWLDHIAHVSGSETVRRGTLECSRCFIWV